MDRKEVQNKQIVLKGYIERFPLETDLELKLGNNVKLKVPKGSGSVLVKNLYLSCDPYMRTRMRNCYGSYFPPFLVGKPIEGFSVSKVVESDVAKFRPGDIVTGLTGWEEYSLIENTKNLRKIQQDEIPLSYHIGLLDFISSIAKISHKNDESDIRTRTLVGHLLPSPGMPGFTAYAGFYEVCSPEEGDRVFISAASGAVGHLVGQFAKLYGCYVVGSAGTKEKVEILKQKLGFDGAFNYKEEKDLDATLKRFFPEGIDVYFDNVGGPMLDAVLLNMRKYGRIALCGMVSQYSYYAKEGIHNLSNVIINRVRLQGFIQSDYSHLIPKFVEHVGHYYRQGKIVYIEDIQEGLECAPSALAGLFTGKNVGKQVICVSQP